MQATESLNGCRGGRVKSMAGTLVSLHRSTVQLAVYRRQCPVKVTLGVPLVVHSECCSAIETSCRSSLVGLKWRLSIDPLLPGVHRRGQRGVSGESSQRKAAAQAGPSRNPRGPGDDFFGRASREGRFRRSLPRRVQQAKRGCQGASVSFFILFSNLILSQ